MIKVTFLTGEYPPMQGGIADHTAYLAEHLAPLGVESSILISRRWEQSREEVRRRGGGELASGRLAGRGEEARMRRDAASAARLSASSPPPLPPLSPHLPAFSPPRLPASPPPPHLFPTLPNWGWRCWPAIANFLKTHQPAVLHIQYQAAAFDLGGWVNWLPWYLKKRGCQTGLVTTFHDLREPYIFPKAGPFRRQSILALARHSDAVICTNREDLQILQLALNAGQANSLTYKSSPAPPLPCSSALPLTLIPLGSNVEPQPPPDFDRIAWRQKYGVKAGALLLAYFGFLNESKGGEVLIETLALLRQQGLDAHLLLIGGDVGHADPTNVAYAGRVQALIERQALTGVVHRTGYVDLSQVSANLLAADVVVMPYRDGVSFRRTTLIAALRHGCPVVSTTPADPALIPEIRPGENMLLVPPGDATALAQTIAPLAGDVALRQKLAAGAKQLGALFEWDRIARETMEIYQAVKNSEL